MRLHELHGRLVEHDRREAGEGAAGDRHALRRLEPVAERRECRLGAHQQRIVGVAEVDREDGAAGHDVHEVGMEVEPSDRRDLVAAHLCGHPAHVRDDLRGSEPRVVAHRHRCGARMVGLADDRQLLPGDALDALDRADRDVLDLEDGTLFDVQLDERRGG